MVFPKSSFLKYLERWYFISPENMIFFLYVENERRWSLSKSAWNMVFSLYMRRHHRHDIAPLAKEQRCPCPRKMHLRVTCPASPKKMIFIVKDMVFLLKYLIDWHPRKGQRRSHRKCYTRKSVLRNFAKFTGKNLCQSPFFNKAADLIPATLLGLQLY